MHEEDKNKRRYTDADGMILKNLFDKIQKYDNMWIEQNKCLSLINEYNNGKRYDKKIYIKNFYELQ